MSVREKSAEEIIRTYEGENKRKLVKTAKLPS
jgi:hypothetical protein